MCLDSLALYAPMVFPIVVDNASTDRTREEVGRHPNVDLVVNADNRGFAAAVNQAVRRTSAELLLLLNPDAHVQTSLDALAAAARELGIAAGRLVDQEGKTQVGFTARRFPTATTLVLELLGVNRAWPSNPVNRAYRYLDGVPADGTVDQPAGAFLMFRRDVWEAVGGFDEGFYPVWFEDVDFSLRAFQAGFRAACVPAVTAMHAGGHSVGKLEQGCQDVYWYGSLLRYAAKHFRPLPFRAVCAAAAIGAVLRVVPRMIQLGSPSPAGVCCKLVQLACRGLWCGPVARAVEPIGGGKD